MKAASGYTGGAWDTDPAEATITGATTFTYMIAAQGVSRGLTVVTHNTGEFQRVQGIKLEDWVE